VVCTRDRVAGAGYACSARPDLHTVCRSIPKISSALSAKFAADRNWQRSSFNPCPTSWFQSPVTRLKRTKRRYGFWQSGCDRSTMPASARFRPCNRYTREHPSPSACQFRLLLNGLATYELRWMFSSKRRNDARPRVPFDPSMLMVLALCTSGRHASLVLLSVGRDAGRM
jgi:hypothetical protein